MNHAPDFTTTPGPDLRFDAVDLIGRPGAHRRVERTVPAAADAEGSFAMTVPEGEPIRVEAHLESVVEGIYVSGTVSAHLTGECSRCLDPVEEDVEARIDELFNYPHKVPGDLDEDTVVLEGDEVDLGPLVHDALAVTASDRPLCSPYCAGLCAQCGVRLADDPDHHHEVLDPRWAALRGLFADDESTGNDENTAGPDGDAGADADADR